MKAFIIVRKKISFDLLGEYCSGVEILQPIFKSHRDADLHAKKLGISPKYYAIQQISV